MNDLPDQQLSDPPHQAGHELTDIRPIPIQGFAIALVVLIASALFIVREIFFQMESALAPTHRSEVSSSKMLPVLEPPLQSQPKADLARLRSREDQMLSTYSWINPEKNVIRIPIERAITLLAEEGIPEPTIPMPEKTSKEAQP